MTPETIAELRRLAEAATPGPWEWTTDLDALLGGYEGEYRVIDTAMALRSHYVLRVASEDAILIAAAVNALPALLDAAAERDALAAKVEQVRALHPRDDDMCCNCGQPHPCDTRAALDEEPQP